MTMLNNKLYKSLEEYSNFDDDTALVSYLTNASVDRLLDEAEDLNIELTYEDVNTQSLHSLAEYLTDNA